MDKPTVMEEIDERAKALAKRMGKPGWWRSIAALAQDAVLRERKECRDIAWEMQQKQFGGGTAIGNEIAQRGTKS